MGDKNDVLLGSLGLLVLKSLQYGPRNGWDITLHIQSISRDVLRVEEGSLYPALHRMEQQGWVRSEWGVSKTIAGRVSTNSPPQGAASSRRKKTIGAVSAKPSHAC